MFVWRSSSSLYHCIVKSLASLSGSTTVKLRMSSSLYGTWCCQRFGFGSRTETLVIGCWVLVSSKTVSVQSTSEKLRFVYGFTAVMFGGWLWLYTVKLSVLFTKRPSWSVAVNVTLYSPASALLVGL